MNYRNQQGIWLVEFGVYFLMVSILAMLLATFGVVMQKKLQEHAHHITGTLESLFGIDVLSKKLQEAPHEKNQWYKMQEHELIWNQQEHSYGFLVENDRLYFLTGVYHNEENRWVNKTKNIVSSKAPLAFKPCLSNNGLSVKGFFVYEQKAWEKNSVCTYISLRG